MDNLASMLVEFEENHIGSFYSVQDNKTLKINNHGSYPATFGVVKEYKKALSKQLLKSLKNSSMHSIITIYGYQKESYQSIQLLRFTYEEYSGKVYVDIRPYENGCYGIKETKEFNSYVDAKNHMLNMIENLIFDNMHVLPNKENYFTQDMK